jgi:sugar fermentation stimulation protein A
MDADAHLLEIPRFPAVRIAREAALAARFVRRYKRFLADVETGAGHILTVHCPNPGSMLGFHRPGAAVRCSASDDPVESALRSGAPRALAGYTQLEREVGIAGGTRLDFRLSGGPRDPRPAYVEVKSVTFADGRLALFPDSVTERGRRHVEALCRLCGEGARAALLFLVQRGDCDRVAPADHIDPAYGAALRRAAAAGVELFALGARVTARAISVERELPVLL